MCTSTHDIYEASDANPSLEVRRGVFLELFKAFDKVWHGFFYKLSPMGICGKYFELIDSFLSDSFQKVLQNGHNLKLVFWRVQF